MSLATDLTQPQNQTEEKVDLRREYEELGVSAVLEQLDNELVGLKPVKTRIRKSQLCCLSSGRENASVLLTRRQPFI